MFRHHPALAETGELEIAQRQALQAARDAYEHGSEDPWPEAIAAYLSEMRRAWQPEAIEVAEGDYIVVEIGGRRMELHSHRDQPVMRVLPIASEITLDVTKTPE